MSNSTSFTINRERGQQLRALARFHRMTAAALISKWVADEAMKYDIEGPQLGIQAFITPENNGLEATLVFTDDGCENNARTVTCSDLINIANWIEEVIKTGVTHVYMANILNFTIRKSGLALVIICSSPNNAEVETIKVPMPTDIALEVAKHFRDIVREAREDGTAKG